jgi:hypothetical protein
MAAANDNHIEFSGIEHLQTRAKRLDAPNWMDTAVSGGGGREV